MGNFLLLRLVDYYSRRSVPNVRSAEGDSQLCKLWSVQVKDAEFCFPVWNFSKRNIIVCSDQYESLNLSYARVWEGRMICAAAGHHSDGPQTDPCFGDSGGGLVTYSKAGLLFFNTIDDHKTFFNASNFHPLRDLTLEQVLSSKMSKFMATLRKR